MAYFQWLSVVRVLFLYSSKSSSVGDSFVAYREKSKTLETV